MPDELAGSGAKRWRARSAEGELSRRALSASVSPTYRGAESVEQLGCEGLTTPSAQVTVPLFAAARISDHGAVQPIESIAPYLPRDEMEQIHRAILVYPLDKGDVGESIIANPVAIPVVSVVKEGEVSRSGAALVVNPLCLLEALVDDLGAGMTTDRRIGQIGADGRVARTDEARAVTPEGRTSDAHLFFAEHRDALVEDFAQIGSIAT